MQDIIKVIPLSGLDENGRDCYIIEINDDIFVLDAGLSYPDKSMPGIDALLPNFGYLKNNKDRVRAYILGQGHDENCAALTYLYEMAPAPVYCSETTKNILLAFGATVRKKNNYDFVVVDPTSTHMIANRRFDFFQTAHNVSETFGVCIDTTEGNIIYTGDFIIEFSGGDKGFTFDLKALEPISRKKTFLLISESKKANLPGYCSPFHKINHNAEQEFLFGKQRIYVCSFWQNFHRINQIIKLCKQSGKKVYFFNDFTKAVMENLIMKTSWNTLTYNDIVKKDDLLRVRQQDLVVLMLGKSDDLYEDIMALSNGRNEDKRLRLTTEDTFICLAIPKVELETIATRAIDSVYRTKCRLIWLKNKDITSMHARQEDLKFFLSFFKPQYYLPVRGSYVNMMTNAKLALSMGIGLNHNSIFILDNGMTLLFKPNERPRILPYNGDVVPIAPVLVDGLGISKTGADVVEDRRKLGIDGVVVIGASISIKNKSIIAGPDCQMRGFVYVREAEPILKAISRIFTECILGSLQENRYNQKQVLEEFQLRASRFIKRETGRDPMILPSIVEFE